MFLTGLIAALGMLFLLFKFGIKKVIHYDIFFDIAITGFLLFSFAGTYSGMMAAMFGGMLVSIVLYVMKRTMRHEKFTSIKTDSFPYRRFGWQEVR
tara:strand:- start:14327 stop:14614 length:288 start_codon:yes stop_codon:yes gene_type:complete